MKILTRYVSNEILLNFEISLLTISSLMMIYQASRHISSVGTALGLFEILPLLIPSVLVFAFPLSILLATLLTFSRLANDGEMHAMYSCQISLAMVVSPVFILMIFLSGLNILNTQYGVPWSFEKISKLKYKTLINLVLDKMETEDKYISDDVSFIKFQGSSESSSAVMIRHHDKSGMQEIIADDYEAAPDYVNAQIKLKLKNSRYLIQNNDDVISGKSEESYINLPLNIKKDDRRISQMAYDELADMVNDSKVDGKEKRKHIFEMNRKLSGSLSCLVLGLLGMFIGLRMNSGNKFVGVLTVLGLILLVYLPLLTVGKWMSVDSELPLEPWVGAWLPFMAIGFITVFLRPSTKGV